MAERRDVTASSFPHSGRARAASGWGIRAATRASGQWRICRMCGSGRLAQPRSWLATNIAATAATAASMIKRLMSYSLIAPTSSFAVIQGLPVRCGSAKPASERGHDSLPHVDALESAEAAPILFASNRGGKDDDRGSCEKRAAACRGGRTTGSKGPKADNASIFGSDRPSAA